MIFETARLILRPRTLDDADAVVAMNSDPEVNRHLAGHFSDPVMHRREVIEKIARPVPPGLGYWTMIERADTACFAGYVSLIPLEHRGPEVEIGWRMPRSHWGRGLALEAARCIMNYALKTLMLGRVIAVIHPENERSIALAERLGMSLAGRRIAYGLTMATYAVTADRSAAGTPRPAPEAG